MAQVNLFIIATVSASRILNQLGDEQERVKELRKLKMGGRRNKEMIGRKEVELEKDERTRIGFYFLLWNKYIKSTLLKTEHINLNNLSLPVLLILQNRREVDPKPFLIG